MKTPEEYIREFIQPQVLSITSIARMAYQIQKESYNAAIQDAVDNAEVSYEKNHEYGSYETIVDKDSILKLKIK